MMTIPPGTNNGNIIEIKNMGIAKGHSSEKGKQLVHISIDTPKKLEPEAIRLLKEFAQYEEINDS